jgi:Domain of unknown function (DUF4115)
MPTPSPTASQTPDYEVVLKLTATQESWVELTKTANGAVLFEGDLFPGSSQTWTATQTVALLLGNPRGVILTVNGDRINTNDQTPVTLRLSPAAKGLALDRWLDAEPEVRVQPRRAPSGGCNTS